MTLAIKHNFQSLKVDGADATLVRPSNWNDTHAITGQAKSIVANAAASAGAMADVLLGDGLWFNGAGKLDIAMVAALGFFALTTAPTGWLKANGALVSRTTYADLFAKVGTTYGAGDGSTTFALPDLRAMFLRGLDDGKGIDTSRALATFQDHMVLLHGHSVSDPGHTHSISDPGHAHGVGDPGHSHTIIGSSGNGSGSSNIPRVDAGAANDRNSTLMTQSGTGVFIGGAGTGVSVVARATGLTVQNNGGAENRVKNYAALICIKY